MTAYTPSSHAIVLDGLTKRFGRNSAVDNLSLDIPAGMTFGFIGPNGAGKTTTIRMLMGMLRSTSGRASILGIDPAGDPVSLKRRVGYVPEFHAVHRSMRVGQVIWFCRPFYPAWNDKLCTGLLKLFALDAHQKVRHLSKGALAKLSLLLALAHEPEVLILDEPMSGLDPLTRDEFLDGVLNSLCDRPRTVLFSSHLLGDVQRLADTIGIIHQGRLLLHCSTDDLVTRTKRIRAVLRDGCTPSSPPEGTIWQRVQQREWLLTVRGYTDAALRFVQEHNSVDHVEVLDVGLEEIFKDIIRGQRVPT